MEIWKKNVSGFFSEHSVVYVFVTFDQRMVWNESKAQLLRTEYALLFHRTIIQWQNMK